MTRIAYVCEGGSTIGWGHVGRGRSLAEQNSAVTLVVGRGHGEVSVWKRDAGAGFSLLPWAEASIPLAADDTSWTSVVVDAYDVANDWIASARLFGRVIVVDDWQRTGFECRVLVNANVGASAVDYADADFEVGLFGPDYAFVREEILSLRGRSRARAGSLPRVLLSLGGSDPSDATSVVVEALRAAGVSRRCSLDVIVGASYAGRLAVTGEERVQDVRVLRQPREFAALLAAADLVVCGGSVTSYEAACLGRPFVPVAIVDNQRRITAKWAEMGWGSDAGVGESGWVEAMIGAVESALGDLPRTSARALGLMELVDGLGPKRVLEALV